MVNLGVLSPESQKKTVLGATPSAAATSSGFLLFSVSNCIKAESLFLPMVTEPLFMNKGSVKLLTNWTLVRFASPSGIASRLTAWILPISSQFAHQKSSL